MAMRTAAMLVLLILVPSTEASLSPPVVCYILDGFLLLYCIVFTALFFQQKLKSKEASPPSNMAAGEDPTYEELPPASPSSGAIPKRRQGATEDTYQTLQSSTQEDSYQVLKGGKTRGQAHKVPRT